MKSIAEKEKNDEKKKNKNPVQQVRKDLPQFIEFYSNS